MPKPLSAYVVNRKLCTIRLAKADTPAIPQTPETHSDDRILQKPFSCKIRAEHRQQTTPARRNMIPAVRVMLALMLSSMFPIFRHLSANMAIRQLIAPRTMPTIIRARTAWSRAESQSESFWFYYTIFLFFYYHKCPLKQWHSVATPWLILCCVNYMYHIYI